MSIYECPNMLSLGFLGDLLICWLDCVVRDKPKHQPSLSRHEDTGLTTACRIHPFWPGLIFVPNEPTSRIAPTVQTHWSKWPAFNQISSNIPISCAYSSKYTSSATTRARPILHVPWDSRSVDNPRQLSERAIYWLVQRELEKEHINLCVLNNGI